MASSTARYKQNRLQQLRGFCLAARTQNISKAAELMLLSQPSVSLQIKALERELGVQLFQRHGPRIETHLRRGTTARTCSSVVEGMDGIEETFAAKRESVDRGTVNIAAGGSTIQYILPPFVERFMATVSAGRSALAQRDWEGGLACCGRAAPISLSDRCSKRRQTSFSSGRHARADADHAKRPSLGQAKTDCAQGRQQVSNYPAAERAEHVSLCRDGVHRALARLRRQA